MIDVHEVVNHDGEKATFIVNIIFRRNASWQGKICWVDGKKTCSFRSALELIKLMDSATDCGEAADENKEIYGPFENYER